MSKAETILTHERSAPRSHLLLVATLSVEGQGEGVPVRVRNLSAGGMMVEGFPELEPDMAVTCELPGLGQIPGRIAWTEAGRAGVAFAQEIDPDLARVKPKAAPQPFIKLKAVKSPTRRPGFRSN